MRILVIVVFLQSLLGCTAVGVFLDCTARCPSSSTSLGNTVEDGLSFSKMGYAVDSAIVEFVKDESNPKQTCRQVTKSLKECVDVEGSNLHTNESHSKQLKTDDEIISVGQ
ncbi:hypothetical protein EU508_15700 [Pseudoalteromonas fuliginea]|uniref:Lipoprotein n=1 Tax=Pseudoalteromonas fuliginea TaxID=1872678 RepID=A0AB73BE24_9GAMM|nr:hypothetical protein [Pseudoalteromonas fuliginea]KAA1158043.1 hypothetical protein EU508_15700 [Pseudoalteromonas fuliginea]